MPPLGIVARNLSLTLSPYPSLTLSLFTSCVPKVFSDGLEVMANMGAVVDSLFQRVQNNLVQTA